MLSFEPIDVGAYADVCLAFRAEAFEISFGSADQFLTEWRQGERYIEHLRSRMAELPGSCVHAWRDGKVVGQIELRTGREDPAEGYVNLYYLIPSERGSGAGVELDDYAVSWFRGRGLSRAALGVSPTNLRAVRFYLKQGWADAGPHPRQADTRLMRKTWQHQREG